MRPKRLCASIILLFFALIPIVYSISPLPLQLYGSITIDGKPAPPGTIITAKGQNEIECGRFVIKDSGLYGALSCNGDDASTIETEGALPGDLISITINGISVNTYKEIRWKSANYIEAPLSAFTGKATPHQEKAGYTAYTPPEPRITLGTILEGITILSFIALPLAIILILRKIAKDTGKEKRGR